MTGLRVTKQQFSDAVKKFGIGFVPSGRIYDAIREAGFVLVDKKAVIVDDKVLAKILRKHDWIFERLSVDDVRTIVDAYLGELLEENTK